MDEQLVKMFMFVVILNLAVIAWRLVVLYNEQRDANATHSLMLSDIVETVHRIRRDDIVRIASAVKLSVEPGDVVLFRVDAKLLSEDVERVRARMAETLPEGVKFQIVSSLVDVTVLSPDE